MGIDIGDDITYVIAVNKSEDRPVLWTYIDQTIDVKDLITEIDRTALRVQDPSQARVSYRFTVADFWRKTFDVRKGIWEA